MSLITLSGVAGKSSEQKMKPTMSIGGEKRAASFRYT